MTNKNQQVIDLIKHNRISTTEVADSLGKFGVLRGPEPLSRGHFVVGKIKHIIITEGNNSSIHAFLDSLEPGEVLLVTSESSDVQNLAVMGELMIKYAILYKGASAVVTNCCIRDTARILKEDYPVWCCGVSPLGATNNPIQHIEIGFLNGGILVADDGGAVVIPQHIVEADALDRLNLIEIQEDIWNFCINTLKWSTYETVVEKRYLTDNNSLPKHFSPALEALSKGFSKVNWTSETNH